MGEPRLIIFDFDGVLANTEDLHFAAFATLLRREGIALARDEYYSRYLGIPDAECIRAALEDGGRRLNGGELEALLEAKRREYAALLPTARLYPGAADALRNLHRRHLLAIASGAFRNEIEVVLERGGALGFFEAVVAAEDVRRGKPAPDPFLCALERVNRGRDDVLRADECLVIEDAPHGIAAARAAGMRCIAVSTNQPRASLDAADRIVRSVVELAGPDGVLR